MREGTVKVVNHLGLHARAAASLQRVARRYQSSIILHNPRYNISADARSILNVLTLSGSTGTVLKIIVSGDDEEEAYAAIEELFSAGFGEI